ncbi:hypothetical protein BDN72DRAFT_896510 [Pluteus cervinus]|uniref:Uncharacterized protein n=1 Tax=Pluteus cervinus TaxID=181527 RepID=A0ACD3AXD1_9AGAR|nr:hypothetical protein BDN72DRAFT_896510 [Pluteus cervinus]
MPEVVAIAQRSALILGNMESSIVLVEFIRIFEKDDNASKEQKLTPSLTSTQSLTSRCERSGKQLTNSHNDIHSTGALAFSNRNNLHRLAQDMNSTQLASNVLHSKCRPSLPLQIPLRRNSLINGFPISPIARPVSPELLFDMSPISPNFPSPSYLGFSSSQTPHNNEPFMYNFPTLRAQLKVAEPVIERRRASIHQVMQCESTMISQRTFTVEGESSFLPEPNSTRASLLAHRFPGWRPSQQDLRETLESPTTRSASQEENGSLEENASILDFSKYLMQCIELQSTKIRR